MKAARIAEYGDIAKLSLVDLEIPVAGRDQVLVKVHAASLNPFDTKVRLGLFKEFAPVSFPFTLGDDLAAEVVQVGSGVSNFAPGEKVYGHANVPFGVGSGSFAEYAVVEANHLGKMPEGIGFNEAASLVVVGVTALGALIGDIALKASQKLFIHGGSGGIGIVAIQLAKHLGAHVTVTATGDGVAIAKKFGADVVIDYKNQNYQDVVSNVDAVLDLVGRDFRNQLSLLKKGGIAVSTVAVPDNAHAEALGVRASFHMIKVNTAVLDSLRSLIEKKVVTPNVSRTFPLTQIREAFSAAESGKTRGKFVIEIP